MTYSIPYHDNSTKIMISWMNCEIRYALEICYTLRICYALEIVQLGIHAPLNAIDIDNSPNTNPQCTPSGDFLPSALCTPD